ncbi:MAG: HIT domain-containing protein [Thiohalomonadales bacterium]
MVCRYTLDQRLRQDSYPLGESDSSILLLMRNALFPWFIIVPHTAETELYLLPESTQKILLKQINTISLFIKETLLVDKINVATIGNVVSQFHIHIVGRKHDDVCWPGVVWGTDQFSPYSREDLIHITASARVALSNVFLIDEGLVGQN